MSGLVVHGARKLDADGRSDDFWLVADGAHIAATGTGTGWRSHAAAGDVTVLDAQTFRGVRRIRAEARPSDDGGAEPARLLDLDWHSDHVNIEACGQRQQVPYVDP